MRLAVWAQCFGAPVYYSMAAGGLATVYAQMFGAKDFMVGVINGSLLVGLLAGFAVPGLIERYNKRRVLLISLAVSVAAILPLLVLPRLAERFSDGAALVVMAAAMLGYSVCVAGARSTWFPALMDFVPPEETGRFFGRMRMAWQTVTIGLFIFCSLVITKDAPASRFQVVIAILIVGMVVRLALLTSLPQRPIKRSGQKNMLGRVGMMLSDKSFMQYMFFSIAGRASVLLIFPSLLVYSRLLSDSGRLGDSGLLADPGRFLIIAMLLKMTTAAASYQFWGRMTDRLGPGIGYRAGLAMICGAHLLWIPISYLAWVTSQGAIAGGMILLAFSLYGAAEAGLGIAITRHGFQLTPRDRAAVYLSIQPNLYWAVPGVGVLLVGWIFALCRAPHSTGWLNPYVVGIVLTAVFAAVLLLLVSRLLRNDETR